MKLDKTNEILDEVVPLTQYAFLKTNDLKKDNNFMSCYQHSDSYGIFHDGKLASYIMAIHFASQIFDHQIKMSGIGYVSSYPENRGHGDISRLMKEILEDLHDEGVSLSNLAPWSETFYRQYGYENTIYQKTYSIEPTMFKYFKLPQVGKILRGNWSNPTLSSLIIKLYQKQIDAGEERNTIVRAKWWWHRLETYYPGRYVAIYVDENQAPQAYMFYHFVNKKFQVDEIYYTNATAITALLNFIGGHISSCTEFEITAPEDSLLEEYFPDQSGLSISVRPYMMSRIIDFRKIASSVKFASEKTANLEVTEDEICPWNCGVWHLVNDSGETSCVKTSAKPDFTGSITNWTKVLLGHLTLKQAIKLGLIKKLSSSKLEFLSGKVSFYDYF